MGATTKTILLASAALAALAVPALANSYFFRTKPLVDPPQAFALAAVSGATPGAVTESAPVKLSGYRGKTASVSGGEYQICLASNCSDQGSSWKTAATANLGADVYARVRVTAAAYGQTATARLAVGDAASNFDVASRAKDTTPDAFSFAPKSGLEVGVPAYSDSVVLNAFDGAPLSVSGGGYQICSTVACTEMDGQALQTAAIAEAQPGTRIRLVAIPATYGATATATLTVGNVVGSFAATARAKDETPDAITFTAKVDQTVGASVDSEVRQLVNHDGVTVSVSGTGASYRVCSESTCSNGSPAFTTISGTAARNAWVQVRQVAPAAGTEAVASLSYGTLTAAFSVKSAAGGYSGAYATASLGRGEQEAGFRLPSPEHPLQLERGL